MHKLGRLNLGTPQAEWRVKRRTVQKWVSEGCPRRNCGTPKKPLYRFDATAVEKWLAKRSKGKT